MNNSKVINRNAKKEINFIKKLKAWISLSRPPFHIVGILPFLLGNILAWNDLGLLRFDILIIGILGAIFIMLATYYSGEYWDFVEDSISANKQPSLFAGGSQVIQKGLIPRNAAFWASITAVILALLIGIILQFIFLTGFWTLPLGILGLICGFFYSTRPIRWVSRGLGEILIGFCYSWLPISVGYYLQVGSIIPIINWISIPIGLTIFNVILLNEFLDYDADSSSNKLNLLVRLGLKKSSLLYIAINIVSWISIFFAITQGLSYNVIWFYIPFLTISFIISMSMYFGFWEKRQNLEKLCALNLIVNIGTTLSIIIVSLW
jgi:1,4-dihydroxy-2-naphthoate octaprenyltransferase